MTRDQKNILAQPYFDGVRWHRDVGQPFDTSKLDGKVVEKLEEKGYLMTASAFKARTNPEAAQAQEAADTSAVQLQAIYDALPGVTTPEGAVTAIQAIQSRVPSAEDLEKVSSARTFVQELSKLFPDAKGTDALLDAVKQASSAGQQAQELQARITTLETLHPTVQGTDLPPNFVGIGKLKPFGLTTYESLTGKTAEQLDAIEGLTLEQAKQIVDKVTAHFTQE